MSIDTLRGEHEPNNQYSIETREYENGVGYVIKIAPPDQLSSIRVARQGVREVGAELGLGDIRDDVEQVASELVANAVEHGGKLSHLGVVHLRDEDSLCVVVGSPWNGELLADDTERTEFADDRLERGRGMTMSEILTGQPLQVELSEDQSTMHVTATFASVSSPSRSVA